MTRRQAVITVLCALAAYATLCYPQPRAPQTKPAQFTTTQAGTVEGPNVTSGPAVPAPDVTPWPLTRFIVVLILGLLISFSNLWIKFHNYRGLRVIWNIWSIEYIAVGGILCVIFYGVGSQIKAPPSIPFNVNHWGSWLFDSLGVLCTLIFPIIGPPPKSVEAAPGGNPLTFSRNPICSALEAQISVSVQSRLHKEINTASQLYSWKTIKLAGRKAFNLETVFTRLQPEEREREIAYIASLPDDEQAGDSHAKYDALLRILNNCQFHLFHDRLEEVRQEELRASKEAEASAEIEGIS